MNKKVNYWLWGMIVSVLLVHSCTFDSSESNQRFKDNRLTYKMYDFVKAQYESGKTWEQTRDAVYQRYQVEQKDGYDITSRNLVCNGCFAAGINFAASLVSLFYGEGDIKETIKIGTLAGWDSDNPTATSDCWVSCSAKTGWRRRLVASLRINTIFTAPVNIFPIMVSIRLKTWRVRACLSSTAWYRNRWGEVLIWKRMCGMCRMRASVCSRLTGEML